MNAQSKLERLLSSFENDTDSISGDVGWMYYGDVDPKDAAADLARITAERNILQKRLDYIKANQTDSIAVRFALIASDEEIAEKEIDAE